MQTHIYIHGLNIATNGQALAAVLWTAQDLIVEAFRRRYNCLLESFSGLSKILSRFSLFFIGFYLQ